MKVIKAENINHRIQIVSDPEPSYDGTRIKINVWRAENQTEGQTEVQTEVQTKEQILIQITDIKIVGITDQYIRFEIGPHITQNIRVLEDVVLSIFESHMIGCGIRGDFTFGPIVDETTDENTGGTYHSITADTVYEDRSTVFLGCHTNKSDKSDKSNKTRISLADLRPGSTCSIILELFGVILDTEKSNICLDLRLRIIKMNMDTIKHTDVSAKLSALVNEAKQAKHAQDLLEPEPVEDLDNRPIIQIVQNDTPNLNYKPEDLDVDQSTSSDVEYDASYIIESILNNGVEFSTSSDDSDDSTDSAYSNNSNNTDNPSYAVSDELDGSMIEDLDAEDLDAEDLDAEKKSSESRSEQDSQESDIVDESDTNIESDAEYVLTD